MNKIIQKIISFFLVLIMAFEIVPITIFAANEENTMNEEIQSSNEIALKESLAEIVQETGIIIPDDLKKIINTTKSYKKLSNKNKEQLCNYLSISTQYLDQLGKKVNDISDLFTIIINGYNSGISKDSLLKLTYKYDVNECINLERKFAYLCENIINKKYVDKYVNIMSDNNIELNDLYGSMILSEITGMDFSWGFEKVEIQSLKLSNIPFDDKADYIYLQLQYNLSSKALNTVLVENNTSPTQLRSEFENFKQNKGLYSLNSDLTTRDVSTQQIPEKFSKYQIPDASNHRNNVSIDQTYGMVTYNKELITLKGKNGLDLQFGIRYDHNDAVVPGNYKGIEHSASVYQVKYITDCYIVDQNGSKLYKKDYPKFSDFYYDESKHNEYLLKEIETEDYGSFSYVYYVKDAEINSKDIAIFQEEKYETSHNNSIYNLGEGWAFTVPSIEQFTLDYSYGMDNVIHFADGQKYSFKPNNNGTYKLIGYDFKDIQLLDAKPEEFICDEKKLNGF